MGELAYVTLRQRPELRDAGALWFHDRRDLAPNVCAVYTDEAYRCQGIAGRLLDIVVGDLRSKGIAPVYLVRPHGLLRTIRLGVSLHGPGGRRARDDEDVYP